MPAFLLNGCRIYLISHTLTSGVKGWGKTSQDSLSGTTKQSEDRLVILFGISLMVHITHAAAADEEQGSWCSARRVRSRSRSRRVNFQANGSATRS
jgi:hypothetical protein